MDDNDRMTGAYAAAGVDTDEADRGVEALVEVLHGIDPGRTPLAVPLPGHFASVLLVAPGLGIALATDSVGSKVIVAEQARRFDTIGIDCVAMNVNDLVCVGAERAGIEIRGGEVCQLPEVIRGHPSPHGFDLVGSAFGRVAIDQIVDGSACRARDALIGVPARGGAAQRLTPAPRAPLARR